MNGISDPVPTPPPVPPLDVFVEAITSRKAEDVVVLEIGPLTSLADYFIICSGHSNRQVSAIAGYVVDDLKQKGIRPLSLEGFKEGHWILIDYGHVVVHIFYESVRGFYDLEGLWADARRVKLNTVAESSGPKREG